MLSAASEDLGYDTRYYYDLYGSQVADSVPQYLHFGIPWNGSISPRIKGPYKVRTFKEGKLTATVYFNRPDLRAIAVEYRLPHRWTEKQLEAALKPYANFWKATHSHDASVFSRLIRQEVLVSNDGKLAYYSPYTMKLTILSPLVLEEFDKALKKSEKKKEKVPEF
ncbi:hypothetical protein G0Q06_10570 [Puniceicoccales bacterium CK1056]|uniref:Uncharacterized protein n=2 Tax=Oceanipulchritudo coccoides TaxID=2706888 RepID=A0A6B2M4W9_9BACT|nr:hypothetical protein [Oceanipulchritudo coccoides]